MESRNGDLRRLRAGQARAEETEGPFADPRDVRDQWDALLACCECGAVMPDSHSYTCSEACAKRYQRRRRRVSKLNRRARAKRVRNARRR